MSRGGPAHFPPPADDVAQRIDKWLWCARLVKTRALGAALGQKGRIRVTRDGAVLRVEKAHFMVRPGDRLAFTAGGRLHVLDILSCADRRGAAEQARTLYKELRKS